MRVGGVGLVYIAVRLRDQLLEIGVGVRHNCGSRGGSGKSCLAQVAQTSARSRHIMTDGGDSRGDRKNIALYRLQGTVYRLCVAANCEGRRAVLVAAQGIRLFGRQVPSRCLNVLAEVGQSER